MSLLSEPFGVHKVHPSGTSSTSCAQLVCGSVGVHQFTDARIQVTTLLPALRLIFFGVLFSSTVIVDIAATDHFSFLLFVTVSVGSRKTTAASK